jgi:hypothetical protein|tara:strand:- start:1082 stop:1219 length:138 start_codon:yes stop_codon:yes gene_type:complete
MGFIPFGVILFIEGHRVYIIIDEDVFNTLKFHKDIGDVGIIYQVV